MMGFTRFNSRQHRRKIIFLILFIAFIYFVSRRDSLYLLRPIWDKKPQPFNTYSFWPYVPAIESDKDYCRHYGWQQRQVGNRKSPRIIDATMISTEVSLFKLRLMETRDHVDMVIVVEADRSFDGTPKPHFPIFNETEIRPYMKDSQVLVYQQVHFPPSEKNPWHNEAMMRNTLTGIILDPRHGISHGDLILMSDVDEISSKETLQLAKVCSLPPILHLNMRDYLYSFEFPLNDNGYWRPKIVTFEATTTFGYNHIRASDELLLHAGWHCSWCFRSIQEYHIKMTGYSHNDRLTSSSQLLPSEIQRKICTGLDIYDMYPEAYTFTDLLRQLGPAPRATEYTHLPAYTTMLQNPEFRFLLPGFCERPLDMLVS